MHRRVWVWRQAAEFFVHIDPQDRGVEVLVDETRVVEDVVGSTAIADADVKVTVRAEVQIASVVVACGITLRDERLFPLPVESRHALMELSADAQAVADEVAAVACELGMKREAEQAALAFVIQRAVGTVDQARKFALFRHRLIELRDLLDAAGFFDHEQPVRHSWRAHHGHRHRKRQPAQRICQRIRQRRQGRRHGRLFPGRRCLGDRGGSADHKGKQ